MKQWDRHTALVLPYNLSRNPWSQVLTLYFSTCSTVSSRPSLPLGSLGRLKSINCTSLSGLLKSTRAVRRDSSNWLTPWPLYFVAASSSADLMNGIIRDWTALSNYVMLASGICCILALHWLLTSSTSSARLRGFILPFKDFLSIPFEPILYKHTQSR